MLTNIDLEKMNHLMETNKDAKEIITQLLKNHDAAVATIAHEIRNPMTVLYSSMQLMRPHLHNGSIHLQSVESHPVISPETKNTS